MYEKRANPTGLILLFVVFTVLFVLVGSVAYAADQPEPADEQLVALLLPDHELVYGVKNGDDQILLLMRNAQKELVFVGGLYDESEWEWTMTESTPLPEGKAGECSPVMARKSFQNRPANCIRSPTFAPPQSWNAP